MCKKNHVVFLVTYALDEFEILYWAREAGFLKVNITTQLHLLLEEILMVYDIFYVFAYHFGLDSSVFFKFLK